MDPSEENKSDEFKIKTQEQSNVVDYSIFRTGFSKEKWEEIEDTNRLKKKNNVNYNPEEKNNFDTEHASVYNKVNTKMTTISSTRGDDMQIDTYLKEVKDDLRERESRNEKRFSDSVEYNRVRDEQFRNETKEREERVRLETKEREERIQRSVDDLKKSFEETKQDNKSTKIAIWTLSLSTILGIAAMIVTLLIS